MKIWKTVGCLALLAAIICGCILLGQSTEAGAQTELPEEQGEEQQQQGEEQGPPEEQEPTEQEPVADSSTTVSKTYSTGLAFRSNGDGTCSVIGVGACTAACILIPPTSPDGDTVTAILPGAFNASIVGAIELPTTVTSITAESFSGAARLTYIRVASGNPAYLEYDGVLYSADGRTLLYCPPMRAARDLSLHPELRRISAGAFADCTSFSNVYFPGNTAEWHSLIVGDDNDALYAASLRFGTP